MNPKKMIALHSHELKQLDQLMVSHYHTSALQLMESAGILTAKMIPQINGESPLILIACGKGNNGGD